MQNTRYRKICTKQEIQSKGYKTKHTQQNSRNKPYKSNGIKNIQNERYKTRGAKQKV